MIQSKRLGIAGGILWGLCMFIVTLISINTGYAKGFLTIMSGIYPGYSISGWGSLVGLVYGFFDVFIGLTLLGWLYNKLAKVKI